MPVRVKRITGAVLVAGAVGGLWIVGPTSIASAADGQGAHSAATVESLVKYLHPNRRLAVATRCPNAPASAPKRCIRYYVVCATDCTLTARSTLVLPGPNPPPVIVSGTFHPPKLFIIVYLKLNRGTQAALKRNRARARLRTRIHAVNLNTGDTDTDRHTFRFRR